MLFSFWSNEMDNLTVGSKGEMVCLLQRALNEKLGTAYSADGVFGNTTKTCLMNYQGQQGLDATGIFDQPTQDNLLPFINERYVTLTDVRSSAADAGLLPAIVYAFLTVEGAGAGFLPDSRPKILFERHHFYKNYAAISGEADAQLCMQNYPNICNTAPGGYIGGDGEYGRINIAIGICQKAALLSASWGLFQIMGEHYADCGYDDVESFVEAMKASEDNHLKALLALIKSENALAQAVRALDFDKIALYYNGSSYAKNDYNNKLRNAFNSYPTA
jgi:hypothetical protein